VFGSRAVNAGRAQPYYDPEVAMRDRFRTSMLLSVLAGLAATAGPTRVEAADGAGVFEFASLNRRYEQLAPAPVPFEQGGVSVRLASPRHQLDLRSNRLVLRPRDDGSYDLALQLEFEGGGLLVADLDVSGLVSRLEDDIAVPPQRRTVLARVRLLRGPEGYLVTPVELPATFEVEIASRVGSRLVGACRSLAALGLGLVDCGGLDRAFSRVILPLPEPGETYLFEAEQLSEAERRQLDAFLAATAPPAAAR
jgi:hypothetical protein